MDARPAALVNGRSIMWGDLRPYLNEAAGAEALRDAIIAMRLETMLRDEGLLVTEDDIAAEQEILLGTLSPDPATALRLLEELRDRQRLGSHRYRALLRRSAMLRALVRGRARVTEAAIEQLYDARYGPQRQVRIMTLPTLTEAQSALAAVRSGASFGEVAVERSTDSSAARGGLLEPFSRRDSAYPASIRQAAWQLDGPGAVSDAILLDNGYAILQLVEERPAEDVALDDVRDHLARLVRLEQERALMDQVVQHIMADTSVTIFDESLEEGWRRGRR